MIYYLIRYNTSMLDEFYPKTINDFSNKVEINNIIAWLTNFEKNSLKKKENKKNSCLLLLGDHGIGKTSMINAIIQHCKYEIKTIVIKNIEDQTMEYVVKNIFDKGDISDILKQKKSKKLLLFDDLESATLNIDKNIIKYIVKYNSTKWIYPIIIISNNKHNKLINYIKQISYTIKLSSPSDSDLFNILEKISEAKKIKYANELVVNKIIKNIGNDYRKLYNILEYIENIYKNTIITIEHIDIYLNNYKMVDFDCDIYRLTSLLLSQYASINKSLMIYDMDKILLPLMVHQNYINGYKSDDLKYEISKSISKADIIENYIFCEQNWDFKDIHGLYSCGIPSYLNNTQKSGYKIKLEFPLDLNRTSIKRINNRNIKNINKILINMNIDDLYNMNTLIYHLINKNKSQECIKILNKYNICEDVLESLLKIDKLQKSKITINNLKNI